MYIQISYIYIHVMSDLARDAWHLSPVAHTTAAPANGGSGGQEEPPALVGHPVTGSTVNALLQRRYQLATMNKSLPRSYPKAI